MTASVLATPPDWVSLFTVVRPLEAGQPLDRGPMGERR